MKLVQNIFRKELTHNWASKRPYPLWADAYFWSSATLS